MNYNNKILDKISKLDDTYLDLGLVEFLKKGGKHKIYIKPEKRGVFTAKAKRAGYGVQEFARHVLANKDKYSKATRKQANFARNFGGKK